MENKKLERKRFAAKDENGNQISEISATSLVKDPAIQKNFQLFKDEVPKQVIKFKVTNEEKMEVTGPAMVPDMDILRKDADTGEFYYCYFTKQDVNDFAELFLTKDYHQKANFEHGTYFTKDICLKESWIVADPSADKSKFLGFTDVTDGTWFITYKVNNPELWKMIKQGDLQGFSVEITIDAFKAEHSDVENDIEEIVDNLFFDENSKRKAIKDIVNFHSFVDIGEISFSDYPDEAVQNANKVLEWRTQNPDKNCGNKILWTRAFQIANKKPLTYTNLKRIALNAKLEAKANSSNYESGCAAVMYDALGGTALIDWSIKRLNQIDTLIKTEMDKIQPVNPRPFSFPLN